MDSVNSDITSILKEKTLIEQISGIIVDNRLVHENLNMVAAFLISFLTKYGLIKDGKFKDFSNISTMSIDYYNTFLPDLIESKIETIKHHDEKLYVACSYLKDSEMYDGQLIAAKRIIRFQDTDFVVLKYWTRTSIYTFRGVFKGDKPDGVCLEHSYTIDAHKRKAEIFEYYLRDSRSAFMRGIAHYGNFTNGVRHGDFITAPQETLAVYEKYVDGIVKKYDTPIRIHISQFKHHVTGYFLLNDGARFSIEKDLIELNLLKTRHQELTYSFSYHEQRCAIKCVHLLCSALGSYYVDTYEHSFQNKMIKTTTRVCIEEKITEHLDIIWQNPNKIQNKDTHFFFV